MSPSLTLSPRSTDLARQLLANFNFALAYNLLILLILILLSFRNLFLQFGRRRRRSQLVEEKNQFGWGGVEGDWREKERREESGKMIRKESGWMRVERWMTKPIGERWEKWGMENRAQVAVVVGVVLVTIPFCLVNSVRKRLREQELTVWEFRRPSPSTFVVLNPSSSTHPVRHFLPSPFFLQKLIFSSPNRPSRSPMRSHVPRQRSRHLRSHRSKLHGRTTHRNRIRQTSLCSQSFRYQLLCFGSHSHGRSDSHCESATCLRRGLGSQETDSRFDRPDTLRHLRAFLLCTSPNSVSQESSWSSDVS